MPPGWTSFRCVVTSTDSVLTGFLILALKWFGVISIWKWGRVLEVCGADSNFTQAKITGEKWLKAWTGCALKVWIFPVIKLWPLGQTFPLNLFSCHGSSTSCHIQTWKKQKLGQVGHWASRESARQNTKRFLIPTGDASTLIPADFGWKIADTQPDTEQGRLEQPAGTDPRCYHRARERGTGLHWAWKKIPGIFVIFLAVWDKKQCSG